MFPRSLIVLYVAQSTTAATTTTSASQSHVISRVCDPAGLEQHPPLCWQQRARGSTAGGAESAVGAALHHLPNKYGGPATVGQCVFGHPEAVNGIFGGGQSCWTGALFGFSGVDGACPEDFECTNNQFFGWFVNGSYSLWIDTPTPRHLRLGFGAGFGADSMHDTVLIATNDVLLVQRGASRLGLTWLDWRTMVGFVEGPDAHFQLEELTGHPGHPNHNGCAVSSGCCNAVKQFSLPDDQSADTTTTHRYWRWEIDQSHDGSGPTICYIGFSIGGHWTTDPSWNVSAPYHSYDGGGAPSGLLTRDCGEYWNSAVSSHGPWTLTLDARKAIAPVGFEYSIFVPQEAPLAFKLLGADSPSGPWAQIFATSNATTGGCAPMPAPPPSPPPPGPGHDPAIRVVNVSSSKNDALALDRKSLTTEDTRGLGVATTTFALSYGKTAAEAKAHAAAAVIGADVAAAMQARNRYILELPPLPNPDDDRFQRKLLSVMKVNSLAPEGKLAFNWSTTCRAPHKWMYLWDGMAQTVSMSHVPGTGPELARDYIRTFLQFQQPDGHLCSVIQPPNGADAHSCSTDASVPNVAITTWDNYQQQPNKAFLTEAFPKLEKYVEWDRQNGQPPASASWRSDIRYLLKWGDAGDAGMDHEQNFCPGGTYWGKGSGEWGTKCSASHYALDYANYLIWECQALAKIAKELNLPARAAYWTALATNVTQEMDEHMWDEATGLHYDLFPNGTRTPFKTVAAFYPLLTEGMNKSKIARIVDNLKSPDFWTAVPVPTVAVSTPDFSSDLDRGPMWEQQNYYIIRGLRLYGYNEMADNLKALSLAAVRTYYDKWGTVFEYYDALNTTDPTQTLRKPKKQDAGKCIPGIPGPPGHCGVGGIREYNFCAGLALLWLRGGE